MSDSLAIGIDLGTTNSCVAVYRNGSVEVIPNDCGLRTTPSWVTIIGRKRTVGNKAKEQASRFPANSIFEVKRLMGSHFGHPDVQRDVDRWPFNVIEGENGKPICHIGNRNFTPEEISAEILKHLKKSAENYLGREVSDAVITVPANFDFQQRQATKDAARIAGLNVLRLVNEPTAAAIAYGLTGDDTKRHVLVYDLGAGTFDVTILSVKGDCIDVLATEGDNHLGGTDFDDALVKYAIDALPFKTKELISQDSAIKSSIRASCIQAKIDLNFANKSVVDISLPGKRAIRSIEVTRQVFQKLCQTHFGQTIGIISQAINRAQLIPDQIDDVILVGGSTRIPHVRALLKDYFHGKEPKAINPDEAVAMGAAIQAAKLKGHPTPLKSVSDIVPLSLGIETYQKFMEDIIPRNAKIPCTGVMPCSPVYPKQSTMRFTIMQGERKLSNENLTIGHLDLEVSRVSHQGAVAEIALHVNENGILEVRVMELGSNKIIRQSFDKVYQDLSEERINEIVEKAKEFEDEDEKEKKRLKAHVDLESYALRIWTNCENRRFSRSFTRTSRKEVVEAAEKLLKWIRDNPDASEFDCRHQRYLMDKKIQEIENPCKRKSVS